MSNNPAAKKIKFSTQEIMNMSFDEILRTLVFQPLETPKAQKVTIDGDIIYIANAPTGSDQADPVWQAEKIDTSSDIVFTWADDGQYTQIAADLTVLTYV